MSTITRFRNRVATALCAVVFTAGSAAQSQSAPALDPGFKDRAMAHVRALAAFGTREAGSERERRAARYVRQQMKKMGLAVTKEPFKFQSFTLDEAVLGAGTETAKIVKLSFNPYSATSPIAGDLVFIAATDQSPNPKADLADRLVVTVDSDRFWGMVLSNEKSRAVLSLSVADYERLKASGASSGVLRFSGKRAAAKSANVVGMLGAKAGTRKITVSAHYDSVGGPGAKDNASGVAVMLELARYFSSLKLPPTVSLRFVAFGAEEFGLLGSKAYLDKHQTDLQDAELLFNIDTVGGDGAIYTDTGGGVRGLPAKFGSQLPRELADKASTQANHKWVLLNPSEGLLWTSSNVPEWLRSAAAKAGTGLGRKVNAGHGSGSDHRVFIQAGVVATSIAVSGGAEIHAPTDVPDAVNAEGMELAGRLVRAVVYDALYSTPQAVK